MFARYDYIAGATYANIISDISAIITGETNKANLSASCFQTSTYILSTNAAGWEVHDASAGTNKIAFKAICVDATAYKYITIDVGTQNANAITFKVWESWNSGSHVGTNGTSTAGNIPIDLISGGILFIGSTNRYIILIGYSSGTFYSYNPHICAEISREDPWHTVANGYPCWISMSSYLRDNGNNYYTRVKIAGASDSVNGGQTLTSQFGISSYGPNSVAYRGIDSNNSTRIHFLVPIYAYYDISGTHSISGKILGGLYLTTKDYGNTGDEITYNSNQYFVYKNTSGTSFAIPKF